MADKTNILAVVMLSVSAPYHQVWLTEINGRNEHVGHPRHLTVSMERSGADCLVDTLNNSEALLHAVWASLPESE